MCHQMANEHEKKQKAKSSSRQTSVSDFEDALTYTVCIKINNISLLLLNYPKNEENKINNSNNFPSFISRL